MLWVPFARGSGWELASDQYRFVWKTIIGPCECWYCLLTADQKASVVAAAARKSADLDAAYKDSQNNLVGAFAEVVFGIRFGLQINQVPGRDGGRDFVVKCDRTDSGQLTIDVKGTIYCEHSSREVRSRFPYQSHWNYKADHIYVLFQVVSGQHVFFRGFAFGNDKRALQRNYTNGEFRTWVAPSPSRSLAELEDLVSNRPGPRIVEEAEVEKKKEGVRIVAVNPQQLALERSKLTE